MLPKCSVCGYYVDTANHLLGCVTVSLPTPNPKVYEDLSLNPDKYMTRLWKSVDGDWMLDIYDKEPFNDSQERTLSYSIYNMDDVDAVRGEALMMLEWADVAEGAIADGKLP